MTTTGNLGEQAIDEIAAVWEVASRFVRQKNALHWWPGDYRVSVRAEPDPERPDHWALIVQTDVLRDVPLEDSELMLRMAVFVSASVSTYAWIFPPHDMGLSPPGPQERSRLRFANRVPLYSEIAGWMPQFLARMSTVQVVDAPIRAEQLPRVFEGGVPDNSFPDTTNTRGAHPILLLTAMLYKPLGAEMNRWRGSAEFKAMADSWSGSDLCIGSGDREGATLETPFGSNSAVVEVRADQNHPQLGAGLLGTVRLPMVHDLISVARECAFLNALDLRAGDVPLFGSWHPREFQDGAACIAFTSFVPNALFAEKVATNTAIWLIDRVRWARQQLLPEVQDLTMPEIIDRRSRLRGQ